MVVQLSEGSRPSDTEVADPGEPCRGSAEVGHPTPLSRLHVNSGVSTSRMCHLEIATVATVAVALVEDQQLLPLEPGGDARPVSSASMGGLPTPAGGSR